MADIGGISKELNKPSLKKKESFKQRFLKAIRMSLWKRETFVGEYHTIRNATFKYIGDRNIILIHLDRGTKKIHEFDFRMNSTKAKSKEYKWTLYYVEDNWFMRKLGFKNNFQLSSEFR